METATQKAVPKIYIPEYIKLEFFNNSNLKYDIQNRIDKTIKQRFLQALNEIKGDNKNNYGIEFSEITLLAMAYFYSEIFTEEIKTEFYTLEMVKGFFDADNLTPYTAIYEIDVQYSKLKDAELLKHCWLIIQTAWYFNSEHFGHHQHIDYVNYYISTGQKLPIELYKYDCDYLEKKYSDVDNAKSEKIPINGFTLVNHWYYNILFLICRELNLSVANFKITVKNDREYNPLTKTSRQLRPLAPFKIIECDLKSAFPTFIDMIIGSTLKDHVYSNLMQSKNIDRSKAKILFNKICNSGAYKSESYTIDFFKYCGYSEKQAKKLVFFTHNPEKKFLFFMTDFEKSAISDFKFKNDLKRGARLHDAVLLIDEKTTPKILTFEKICDFGFKALNKPIIQEGFKVGTKFLKYAYVNSIPKGLKLVSKMEFKKPQSKGTANGFKFYVSKYDYITASFNLNDYTADYSKFISNCETMFSSLIYLNKMPLKSLSIYFILRHIRQQSNYIFNVRALYSRFKKFDPKGGFIEPKSRNYDIITNMTFKKNIDFLKAIKEAEKLVNVQYNYKDVFDLLEERICNNDYSYIDEITIKGRKQYNLLSIAIIRYFNLICTGQHRKRRQEVKSSHLYNSSIKVVTVKSLSLPKQQQNAYATKKIKLYERELKNYNRLINNRQIAKQLIFILVDAGGLKTDITLKRDKVIIDSIKIELMKLIDKEAIDSLAMFNKMFPKCSKYEITEAEDLNNIFDTDLSNSYFNQIDEQQAYNRTGERGLNEWLKFHKLDKVEKSEIVKKKAKEKYILPEIDFE